MKHRQVTTKPSIDGQDTKNPDMPRSQAGKTTNQPSIAYHVARCAPFRAISGLFALAFPGLLWAAQANDAAGNAELIWNLVIAATVLVFSLASAVLPVAAIRQWQGAWRISAILPLLALLAWIALIAISKSIDADSHRLWPFEIFAWSMLNMIYMVSAMTIKRIFEKADQEKLELARQQQDGSNHS